MSVAGTGSFFAGRAGFIGEGFRFVESESSSVLFKGELCLCEKVDCGGVDKTFSPVCPIVQIDAHDFGQIVGRGE